LEGEEEIVKMYSRLHLLFSQREDPFTNDRYTSNNVDIRTVVKDDGGMRLLVGTGHRMGFLRAWF
jgi:hypothetical protein